jgi:biopolymer transport protein ExbD
MTESIRALSDQIRLSVKNGSECVVYIRADARAKYRSVEDVLDEVHSSGVEHVVFLVDQRRSSVPQ